MRNNANEGIQVDRRSFLKKTTIAGMAAALPNALPTSNLLAQTAANAVKISAKSSGGKRKMLFLNNIPQQFGKLIESVQAIPNLDLIPVTASTFKTTQEIVNAIQSQSPDIVLMRIPRIGMAPSVMADALETLDMPVVVLPENLGLIMGEADMVAQMRTKGVNAMLATDEAKAIELSKILAAPGVLAGKKAIIYGRPFDSTSVTAHNLNADIIYKRTGIKIEYRPIEDLKAQLEGVSVASAQKELDRWKKEAYRVDDVSDKALLDTCRVYVLLRSIIEKEGLSGISIDCLSFSFNARWKDGELRDTRMIPLPCLAFTRLRDEGYAAPCEADVVGMLSSMVLQEISQKPSYFCNVSEINSQKSHVILRHCVAPLKLLGRDKPALKYRIRDYHGMGGATPEVQFPVGVEITMGGFTKDLKNFVVWPGRIQPEVMDTKTPSFANATGDAAKMLKYCSNRAEVKIKEVDRFMQNIAEIHHTMVAGNYANALRDEMIRVNANIVGPMDASAPVVNAGAPSKSKT
jgi:L-fucose isomerase-like protein